MSPINSQNNSRSFAFAQLILTEVVEPLREKRLVLSDLQVKYQSAMGKPDVEIAERLGEMDGRVQRLSAGVDSFMRRSSAPLPAVLSPIHVMAASDAAGEAEVARQRASVDWYVAAEFPGLYQAAVAESAPDTGTEHHVQVDRSARLDDLEQTLSKGNWLQSNGSVYPLSAPQKDAILQLVASAVIQANCEDVDDARRGRVDSPATITRALLSFGGAVRGYDRALIHARDNGCLKNEDGTSKKSYVVNQDLLGAFRDGSLSTEAGSDNWPNLSRIASLCGEIEPRGIAVALREPTSEQVERIIASITRSLDSEPVFRTALDHLFTLHLGKEGNTPSFTSSELVPDDSDSSPGSALFAKRELQRLGLTFHLSHNRSEECLTTLGIRVLEDPRIFNRLCEGLDQIEIAPFSSEVPKAISVSAPQEEDATALEPTTPSVDEGVGAHEVGWADVVNELTSLTGRGSEEIDADSLCGSGLEATEMMLRITTLRATYGEQTPPLEEVLDFVSSRNFWKRISMPRTVADMGNAPGDQKDPRLAGFEKLRADITVIAQQYSRDYPKLADAEAIAEVVVEGFIFHGSPLIGRNARLEHEVMRTFRKGQVSPEYRERMEKAFAELKVLKCANIRRSPQGGNSVSLNVEHPFILAIAPKLHALLAAAGAPSK